jgi:hypothetical protein
MTTFDLESVRRFATEVSADAAKCSDNDAFCSDLDNHIACLAVECAAWRVAVKAWASAVYHGRAVFDAAVEELFRQELARAANKARPHAEHGREVVRECVSLDRLNELEDSIADLDFLTTHWVRPQPAVLVGGRAEVPGGAAAARAADLPPLPAGWLPGDPGQRRRFQRKG